MAQSFFHDVAQAYAPQGGLGFSLTEELIRDINSGSHKRILA